MHQAAVMGAEYLLPADLPVCGHSFCKAAFHWPSMPPMTTFADRPGAACPERSVCAGISATAAQLSI